MPFLRGSIQIRMGFGSSPLASLSQSTILMEQDPVHFKQMMIDGAREGSFGKVDNKTIAKGLLPSLLENLGSHNAAKVRTRCAW